MTLRNVLSESGRLNDTRKSDNLFQLRSEHINWGNYDMIVIDESHNFRNGGNVDEELEIRN